MPNPWIYRIWAGLVWLVAVALALLILLLGGNFYQLFIFHTLHVDRWANTLWVNIYYFVTGMIWLGSIMFMQSFLFNKVNLSGLLLTRSLFIGGIEIMVIGMLHLGINAYAGFQPLNVLLSCGEVLIAGVMIWFARRKQSATSKP